MTPHNYEIVDCGAFCEVVFSASHPRIYFGTFSTVSPELMVMGSAKRSRFQSDLCLMLPEILPWAVPKPIK
jgi:hypothetical protein